jgi:hypothetical protein
LLLALSYKEESTKGMHKASGYKEQISLGEPLIYTMKYEVSRCDDPEILHVVLFTISIS